MSVMFLLLVTAIAANCYGIYRSYRAYRDLQAASADINRIRNELRSELQRTHEYNSVLARKVIERERNQP